MRRRWPRRVRSTVAWRAGALEVPLPQTTEFQLGAAVGVLSAAELRYLDRCRRELDEMAFTALKLAAALHEQRDHVGWFDGCDQPSCIEVRASLSVPLERPTIPRRSVGSAPEGIRGGPQPTSRCLRKGQ